MSDMDERIERAAKAWSRERGGYFTSEEVARCIIKAAFPELFEGAAWVAPMVLSAPDRLRGMVAMRRALDSAEPPSFSEAFREGFEALRDARLKGLETDAKVEG